MADSLPTGAVKISRSSVVWQIFAGLVLVTLLAFRVPRIAHRVFDPDEFQHLHGAYCITTGLVPYRDYFDHHTPWLHYGLALLLQITGPTVKAIFVARWLMLAGTVSILVATWLLGRRLYHAAVGAWGAVVLASILMFTEKTLEIRPDVPAVALWITGLWLLVRGWQMNRWRDFWGSGLACGAALMFTQKTLFGLLGVGVALVWWHIDYRGELTPRAKGKLTLAWLAGLAVPILVTLVGFAAAGALGKFWECNFGMNFDWRYQFWPYGYMTQFIRQNPLIAVVGMAGWCLTLLGLVRWENVRRGAVVPAFVTLSLLIGLYLIPVPYRQYYQLVLPLLALQAARLLWCVVNLPVGAALREKWRSPRERVEIWVWLIGAGFIAWALVNSLRYSQPTLLGSAETYHRYWWWLGVAAGSLLWPRTWERGVWLGLCVAVGWWATPLRGLGMWFLVPVAVLTVVAWLAARRELAAALLAIGLLAWPVNQLPQTCDQPMTVDFRCVEFVLQHTAPTDKVFDGFSGAGVFRPHAYYYYFLHAEMRAMLTDAQRGPAVVKMLESVRPKIVIDDGYVRALRPEVQQFIEAHYRSVGFGDLWERKD